MPPPDTNGATLNGLETYINAEAAVDQPGSPLVVYQWLEKHWDKPTDPRPLRPYRCIVAWRITRLVARAQGFIGPTGLLSDAPSTAWLDGSFPENRPPRGADVYVRGLQEVLMRPGGLPLGIPHDLHARHPLEQAIFFERFTDAVEAATTSLQIINHPAGLHGLLYLIDPQLTNWPEPEELFVAEHAILDLAWQQLVEEGPHNALQNLVYLNGFDPREAREILATARAREATLTTTDLDEARVILLAKLEKLELRARAAFDLKTERTVLKDTASIYGLTRTAPEDLLQEVTRAMRRVAQEPQPRLVDATADLPTARSLIPAHLRRIESDVR